MTAVRLGSFRRLAFGLFASQLGDWVYNVALLAYVFDRTHSGAWLGATTAARVFPLVVLGPLGGVLADRVDRRRLMIAADVVRAALMVVLAGVAAAGLPLVLVPAVATLATAAGSAYPACTAATVPRLVPPAQLAAANAVRAAIGPVCVVAGPALGAVALVVGGAATAFALNAVTFAVSALAVAGIADRAALRPVRNPVRRPRPRIAPPANRPLPTIARPRPCAPANRWAGLRQVRVELAEGASALLAHRRALRLVGADVLASAVYGVLTVALLLVARHVGLGPGGYGLLLGAAGLGGVAGTAVGARLEAHPRALAAGLLLVALPLPALGGAAWLPAVLLLAAFSGAGACLVEVLAETGLQRELDERVLARAYGFAFPAAVAGVCAGSTVAAPLIAVAGLTPTLTLVAGGVLASAAWPSVARDRMTAGGQVASS